MSNQTQSTLQKREDVPNLGPGNTMPYPVLGNYDADQMKYEDGAGVWHYIYLPEGQMLQAAKYYKEEDWEALARFPKWSR